MGARAQVLVKDAGVYLYTHWGADGLEDIVKQSLDSERGKNRRNDDEYLARIIFEDMIDAESGRGGETGFGIGNTQHTDIEKLVIVTPDEIKVEKL